VVTGPGIYETQYRQGALPLEIPGDEENVNKYRVSGAIRIESKERSGRRSRLHV